MVENARIKHKADKKVLVFISNVLPDNLVFKVFWVIAQIIAFIEYRLKRFTPNNYNNDTLADFREIAKYLLLC